MLLTKGVRRSHRRAGAGGHSPRASHNAIIRIPVRGSPAMQGGQAQRRASGAQAATVTPSPFRPRRLGRFAPCDAKGESPPPPRGRGRPPGCRGVHRRAKKGHASAKDRAGRGRHGRPQAQGEADRCDPGVHQPGDADRSRLCRRWRHRHRLQLHDRNRRPLGDRADRPPSGAAADRTRSRARRGDLAGALLPHPCDRRRRDHVAGACRDRHRALGHALPAVRAAAPCRGRRRAEIGAALHDRRRLAAHRDRRAGR